VRRRLDLFGEIVSRRTVPFRSACRVRSDDPQPGPALHWTDWLQLPSLPDVTSARSPGFAYGSAFGIWPADAASAYTDAMIGDDALVPPYTFQGVHRGTLGLADRSTVQS
jgi:hypothetical protein